MPNGAVTTAAVANYLGELFQTSKRPNNFLKMLGGIQGQVQVSTGIEFPIGVFFNLRAPSQPAVLEGAAAPTPQHRAVNQATNVIQIVHEAVHATYLAQSDHTMSGAVAIPVGAAQGQVINPRDPAWQVMAALETIAQDLNYSCLRGVYAKPADAAATALRTRGLLTALATNVVDKTATAAGTVTPAIYRKFVEDTLLAIILSNGYAVDNTFTWFGDAAQFANIQAAWEALAPNRTPESRDIAGMKIRTIVTKFGTLNIVLEPDMPADKFLIANMGVTGLVGLPVRDKGILFEEPLAKDGSSDKTQIYGQLGCDHGPEYFHGVCNMAAGISL